MKCRFVIWVALALPACKDHELEQLKSVRDEVCACKTLKCANAAMTKLPLKDIKSTPRSQDVANDMLDCLADLDALDRPTLDPDAAATTVP